MKNIRFDVQEVPDEHSEIRLIYCAISRDDGTWHSTLHSHSHAELFYCMNGQGVLQIGDEKLSLHKNACFLINPSVEHTEYSDPNDILEYIVIGVSGVRFCTPQGSYPRYYLVDDRSNAVEILPYFQDVLREVSKQRENYLSVCLSILDILFAKISRFTHVDISADSPIHGAVECVEVKRLIDEHFSEQLSLDWLAEQAHISKYYLSRAFHHQFGYSPMQYLCRKRLHEACHFLRNTDYSLATISTMTGFSSASYFSQTFKRVIRVSPSQYRAGEGTGI